MNYNKPPIEISAQIAKLKGRGLRFDDETKAAHYLSNISYYRLRAYTYPFQDNTNPHHPFIKPIKFEEIIDLYVFDRRFRILVFDALEKKHRFFIFTVLEFPSLSVVFSTTAQKMSKFG